MAPRNRVLDGVHNSRLTEKHWKSLLRSTEGQTSFAAVRSDKMALQPFVTILTS